MGEDLAGDGVENPQINNGHELEGGVLGVLHPAPRLEFGTA